MSEFSEIKKALEGVGSLKVEFTPDCDESNSIIAPINDDYDGTFFTVIGCGDKQDKLGAFMAMAVNALPELLSTLESLQRENEELRHVNKRLLGEATVHSMEARGANATINEIYQIISGGKGEPGNWNGAEPVRAYVEVANGEVLRLETELALSKPVYSSRQLQARAEAAEAGVNRLREALGAVLAAHDIKSVKGKLLEDVIASATERARTALASTGGEHNAE